MSVITDEMVERGYEFYQSNGLMTDDWMRSVLEAGCGAEIERLKAVLRAALAAWQEGRDLDERQILAALEGKP